MTLRRLTFYVSLIILVICIAGLALLFSFLLFVPGYAERELLPEIAKDSGINVISLEVRNVGLRGADLSDIRIGKDQKEALIIDSVRIDYSLSGILNRIVDRIAISGLNLTLKYRDGGLSIFGLDTLIDKNKVADNERKNAGEPVVVKDFEITNSEARFISGNKSINIPFGLSISSFSQHDLPKELDLRLFPGAHEIIIKGNAVDNNDVILSLVSDHFPLSLPGEFLVDYIPLDLKGKAGLRISSKLRLSTFELSDISASLISDNLELNYSGVTLKNPAKGTPVELSIESKNAARWQYRLSRVLTSFSSHNLESDFEGRVDLSGDSVNAVLTVKTVFADNDKIPVILWNIHASREEKMPLGIQIKGAPDRTGTPETFQIKAYGLLLTGESPEIEIGAEYGETGLISSYHFTLKNIKAHNNKMNFSTPLVSVKGNAGYVPGKRGKADSSFSIESSTIIFNGYDLTAEIPGPVIKGSIKYDDKPGFNADARLFLDNGVASGLVEPFNITGLSGSIPFSWPFDKKKRKGELTIETLSYEGHSAGPLKAEYLQSEKNISVNGKLLLSLLPDMNIHITAVTSLDPLFEKGMLQVRIPPYQPEDDIDLKKFIPELEGNYLNGEFTLESDIRFSSSGLKGDATLEVKDGMLSNPANNISLDKITLSLKIKDLFSGMSDPGQKLKINKITYGDIIANNFNVDFRIDPALSLFVEQGEFTWADGKINIKPFKIVPSKDEYDITLFCDRLKLSEILDQLGVAEASGGGTVNGKIPVKITKGKVSFQDGFLYSSPGGGGKINITETDILTAGLSPGSPEYAQMDIAREALKAFEYSWVKMTLNSENDELVMQLQFDGKPENKLPFRYNSDVGSFIRVDTGAEGSVFQGIRLDVNFRVPLNEILNYKDVLNMIE